MQKIRTRLGFTVLELLVVIAIIGILTAIVLTQLGSSKARARKAAALSSLRSAAGAALLCLNGGGTINGPGGSTGGSPLCSTSAYVGNWPTLPTGWSYETSTSDAVAQTFQFSAYLNGSTSQGYIVCNERSCSIQV